METVFDALKAMGKATSIELAARLDISREEVLNELWELKKAGFVDKSAYTWRVADNNVQQEQPAPAELPEETARATVAKISECDLTATIEQRGPQTADELATLFGTTSRKVASTLAMAISKGRLIRVNQNGKFRYCMPDEKINDMSAQSTSLVQVGSGIDKNEIQSDRNRFSSTKNMSRAKKMWRTLCSRCHRLLKRERMTWFYHHCIWQTANCVGRKIMSRSGSVSAPRCGN